MTGHGGGGGRGGGGTFGADAAAPKATGGDTGSAAAATGTLEGVEERGRRRVAICDANTASNAAAE